MMFSLSLFFLREKGINLVMFYFVLFDLIKVSPSPSPVPANTLNTTKPEGNSVLKADNSTSINNSSISSNIDNKSNNSDNNNTGIVGPSSILGNRTDREAEKNNDETKKVSEEKDHHKTNSEAEVGGENCTTLGTKRCTDLKSMSACILGFDSGNDFLYIVMLFCFQLFSFHF